MPKIIISILIVMLLSCSVEVKEDPPKLNKRVLIAIQVLDTKKVIEATFIENYNDGNMIAKNIFKGSDGGFYTENTYVKLWCELPEFPY